MMKHENGDKIYQTFETDCESSWYVTLRAEISPSIHELGGHSNTSFITHSFTALLSIGKMYL
jgi:hypothetical protein